MARYVNDKKWNLTPFQTPKSRDSWFGLRMGTGRQSFQECSGQGFEKAHLGTKQSEDEVTNTTKVISNFIESMLQTVFENIKTWLRFVLYQNVGRFAYLLN